MKPILFSTPMVKAIREGRKTQTRRLVKPQPDKDDPCIQYVNDEGLPTFPEISSKIWAQNEHGESILIKPKYKPGDILWVRETWTDEASHDHYRILYKADDITLSGLREEFPGQEFRWYPSIHMPREAARIFLEVKNVRCERLQDISEEDAKAEGVLPISPFDLKQLPNSLIEPGGKYGKGFIPDKSYRAAYYQLWDTLNAKRGYSWESNPWVWVYEFERVEK